MRRLALGIAFLMLLLPPALFATATVDLGLDPATYGQWSAPFELPVQGEDVALLPTGEVLMFEVGPDALLWNASTGATTPAPVEDIINCVGIALMADGRVLVNGGHWQETWHGTNDTLVFDPFTRSWERLADMHVGRYYPGTLALADGRVLTVSGNGPDGDDASVPEVFDGEAWTLLPQAELRQEFYPRMHVLPDGDIISTSQGSRAYRLDGETFTWTAGNESGKGMRWGGVSVLMPDLRNVLVFGGGSMGFSSEGGATGAFRDHPEMIATNVLSGTEPATASAQILDTQTGEWKDAATLTYARRDGHGVLLPDGSVLAVGGGTGYEPVPGWIEHALSPELYDPAADTWSLMAPANRHRGYHSSAILLPDARVLVSGGDFELGAGSVPGASLSAEIFSPPYLFRGERPTILGTETVWPYEATMPVRVDDATDLATVVLVRLSSATHSLNTDQRVVPLAWEATADDLVIARVPDAPGAAPPGWYMLFLVDADGVPSEATMVRIQ